MPEHERRFCASLSAPTVAEAAAGARALPGAIGLVELRADLLDPAEASSSAWMRLPSETGRSWVFTWRSPEEGGRAPRPRGAFARALEAGFEAVDVEAAALERGDEEARAVPVERRWVSRHRMAPLTGPAELVSEWIALARHEGALRKLVVLSEDFRVNDWVLDLLRESGGAGGAPRTVFASGWTGHVSRVLGYLHGNAVTYLSTEEGEPTAPGQPSVSQALDVYQLPGLPPGPRLFGVLGQRAGRSRSPEIHNHAFRVCGERALYLPLVTADPGPVLDWLRAGRLRGLSVTMPHKEAVLAAVDRPEEDARAVGAVNTLWMEDGRLHGANTDYEAAREILSGFAPAPGARVAVIGAGGAAAAALAAARSLGLTGVVYNRSAERGRALAGRMGARFGGAPEALVPAEHAVVVNATPMGAGAPWPEALERAAWSGVAALDLAYGEGPTSLERAARSAGVPFVSGLEFLALQAAGQFRRWMRRSLAPEHFRAGLRR